MNSYDIIDDTSYNIVMSAKLIYKFASTLHAIPNGSPRY